MVISRARKAFERLADQKGSNIIWHKEGLGSSCPCRTKQGFRDPEKHNAISNIVQAWNNTTPDVGNHLPLADNTPINYLLIPYLASDVPGVEGNIGRGVLISGNTISGNTFQFNITIPLILRKNLVGISIFRSVQDLSHFESLEFLRPADLDLTTWTDHYDYGTPALVPLSQVDTLECNDDAIIPIVDERKVKGFVQPAFIGTRSRSNQIILQQFGEVQADDHIGFFPLQYEGYNLDFSDWSNSGSDWIEFNGLRFIAVTWNLLPAPDSATVNHHWEVALRRINTDVTNETIVP